VGYVFACPIHAHDVNLDPVEVRQQSLLLRPCRGERCRDDFRAPPGAARRNIRDHPKVPVLERLRVRVGRNYFPEEIVGTLGCLVRFGLVGAYLFGVFK
jgi:hypothetical protein